MDKELTPEKQATDGTIAQQTRKSAMRFSIRQLLIVVAVAALLVTGVKWLDLDSPDRRILRLEKAKSGDITLLEYARHNLFAKELSVRMAAAEAIGKIGPAAGDSLDDLIVVLKKDIKASPNAAWAIGQIRSFDPKAIDALQEALESTNHETRRYAAFAISCYGTFAASTIPKLERHLDDYNSAYMGARALGEMGPFVPATTIAKLTTLLERDDAGARAEACMALAKLAQSHQLDSQTISMIEELSSDDDPIVRRFAQKAMEEIQVILQNPVASDQDIPLRFK